MKTILASLFIFMSLNSNAQEKAMTYSDRAKDAFTRLDINNLQVVDEFYDQNLEFIDPIGKISGRDNMRSYYKKMYQDLKTIKFTYQEAIESDKTVVLVWTMTYAVDKLNGGEPITIQGNSVIKFGGSENKVIYHRDYFDVGAMVYEFIPVLGWGVRKVKEKLGEH
jgi:limonene-1,2-epoxide hydrolase